MGFHHEAGNGTEKCINVNITGAGLKLEGVDIIFKSTTPFGSSTKVITKSHPSERSRWDQTFLEDLYIKNCVHK